MAACAKNVMILGHSFIRRLRDFINNSQGNDNLRLLRSDFNVIFSARGGLTIHKLANSPEMLDSAQLQDICFLQIGSNDLCDNYRSVNDIANAIFSFASYLVLVNMAKLVIIGQVLRRLPQVAGERYNERVLDLNDLLKTRCESSDLNIHFWNHRGFWDKQMSYLASDGVHLQHPHIDARPMLKYLRSIRSAILFHTPSISR